tara:strand:+ start:4513 stop:5862 length:1350 start_codon:yes stop_codon:yes gene_type:complete
MAIKRGFAGLNEINNRVDTTSNFSNSINELADKVIFARVTDIILDNKHPKFIQYGQWNGLGTIEFEFVNKLQGNFSQTATALPLLPSIKNYPLVNEVVVLFLLPSKTPTGSDKYDNTYYYMNPVSIWNTPHHNALPKVVLPDPNESNNNSYQSIEEGAAVSKVDSTLYKVDLNGLNPSGGTFVERDNVRPLLPFVGDVITEGRYGNSIRLGSTVRSQGTRFFQNNWSYGTSGSAKTTGSSADGDPITIFRNGQPPSGSQSPKNAPSWTPIVEDINKDPSSIYMTSTQTIPIINSSERYNSLSTSPTLPREYNSNQVILSSGRLVFNSSVDSILLSSIKDISLSSENEVGIDSKKSVTLTANKVNLGSKNASDALIKGTAFMEQFEELLQQVENLASGLEKARVWEEGVPAPDPVMVPIAVNATETVKDIRKLIKDPSTNPLLSKITRTI